MLHATSRRICLAALLAIVACPRWVIAADAPTKKVLILGIDGCRPDGIKAANAPT